ncbi:MAG: EthD family reductase [Acidobacteria bacterium]|nr:MAG: EthD family reductase [Acidobacteriota bacterium]
MVKFMVVLYRRPDLSGERFRQILREDHGALAERLPGLRRYVQNHVASDPNRKHPGWDAVIELYWDDWTSMEAAWATAEGRLATEHLAELADPLRTTWSVVQEEVRR